MSKTIISALIETLVNNDYIETWFNTKRYTLGLHKCL